MTLRELDRLTKHYDTYFQQSDCKVMHPLKGKVHIDGLLYEPDEKYPFWKLATAGASDIKMPPVKNTLANRNEYMMFIDPKEDMMDPDVRYWYYRTLVEVAAYPLIEKKFITYGHSVEWPPEDGEEMVCAYLEMPQAIDDVRLLRCKLGLLKKTACLQVILLNRAETDKLLEIGPEQFSYYLYPEDEDGARHFLCQRKRTEDF